MKKKRLVNIAHRGASGIAPENTASSILEAIKVGADAIEFDVHVTSDKKLVVIHDSFIDRTSNGSGRVEKMTLNELRKFNFGVGKDHEKILTLEEALNLINNRCFALVELKGSVKGNENLVLNSIKKSKQKLEKIWVHSFHKRILKNVRKLNDKIELGYIIVFSFWDKFLMFYYKRFIRRNNIAFFSLSGFFINRPFESRLISDLKSLKTKTYIWTVNDLHSINRSLEWGASGVITNYPGVVKEILKEVL